MRLTPAVVLLALQSLAPLHAQSRRPTEDGVVRKTIEKVYYDVRGDSPAALALQLRRYGPQARGERYFGMTEWEVNADYLWHEEPNACTLRDLKIHVAVQTHLPRWRLPPHAPRWLRRAWSRFLTALDRHERGHRDLAEEAADAIRRRLVSLRSSTCRRVEARAHREMVALLYDYEQRNLAYDRATHYGGTQGAVWPPESWVPGTH